MVTNRDVGERVVPRRARHLNDDPHGSPFLKSEDPATSRRIAALGTRRDFAKGEFVYRQGSRSSVIFELVSGRIRIYSTRPDGVERVLAYADPGASFGESGAFDGLPMYTSAVAVTDTIVNVVRSDAVVRAAQTDPLLLLEIIRRIARKQRLLNASLVADGLPARGRATLLLHQLLEAHGDLRPNDSAQLRLNPPVEELALMAGVTRVTMSRELAHLVATGILARDGRSFVIADVSALRRRVDRLLH